jgi:hypothetical protein
VKTNTGGPESSHKETDSDTAIPYPDYVKSDPVLESIFSRIRTGQPFKLSEFTHFISPLVQDFEAAAADFLHGRLCLSQSRLDRSLLMARGLQA